MNDTTKKLPVETGRNDTQSQDLLSEWGPLNSLLSDFDRTMGSIRRRLFRSPFEPYHRRV